MQSIDLIRGDDLLIRGKVMDDGRTADLAGETWRSQIRSDRGQLIATLVVRVIDAADGTFELSAPAGETQYWPTGRHQADIEFTRGARRASSPAYSINVLPDVTR